MALSDVSIDKSVTLQDQRSVLEHNLRLIGLEKSTILFSLDTIRSQISTKGLRLVLEVEEDYFYVTVLTLLFCYTHVSVTSDK